jgi:N-acetylglutamate synthase-like GNAT family acetyltransferase
MSHPLDVPSEHSRELAPASAAPAVCLRSYDAKDKQEVFRLNRLGLLAGVPDPLDPVTDLADIEDVYFKRPQDHFWVAEIKDHVIASIAIREHEPQVAHVRRLRVDPAWKTWRGGKVAEVLIAKATHHARQHDCLKVVLHTPVNYMWAVSLLRHLGFEYARERGLGGRKVLEFYSNLYAQPE